VATPWSDTEARERYVRFLELELKVMRSASSRDVDRELLAELGSLITRSFPKTKAFIDSRMPGDPAAGFSDEVRAVAWAEARATRGGDVARVPGEWTEREIASDINECFREARRRAGV
jgi:hypothetical protein